MGWPSANSFNTLKPMFKETYGSPSSFKKPAKGVTLRTKPEDVNEVPKKFGFKKLKAVMKY